MKEKRKRQGEKKNRKEGRKKESLESVVFIKSWTGMYVSELFFSFTLPTQFHN